MKNIIISATHDQRLSVLAELSAKYVNDRYLPDKAIDIIDEAGSLVRLKQDRSGNGQSPGYRKSDCQHHRIPIEKMTSNDKEHAERSGKASEAPGLRSG